MQTMKTVVVIGLLSMVMYGVYTVLTEPDSMSPQALENKPVGASPRGLDEPFLEERFESAFDETQPPSTPIAQRDSESARESLAREPVPIDPTAGHQVRSSVVTSCVNIHGHGSSSRAVQPSWRLL